jgi:SRSO17 transposase
MINWIYDTIGWSDAEREEASTSIGYFVLAKHQQRDFRIKRAATRKIQALIRLYLLDKRIKALRKKRREYRKFRFSIPKTEDEYQQKVRHLIKTRSYLYRDIQSIERILGNINKDQKISDLPLKIKEQ